MKLLEVGVVYVATPKTCAINLGIDAAGLRALACHYIVVNNWEGVTASQNVVVVSIPSVLDPSLAPPGKHVVHVYTPGNEPYDPWQGMDRRSQAYTRKKQLRAEVMWQALERIIPDIRSRCEVTLVGTPLTHERYLRRHRGSYGPAIQAGEGIFPVLVHPYPDYYVVETRPFLVLAYQPLLLVA